jgi:signal transduction histidine kinase
VRVPRQPPRADRWWAAGAAIALVAAAAWLHTPRIAYLAGLAAATALSVVVAYRDRSHPRRWLLVASAVLLALAVVAALAEWRVARIDRQGTDFAAAITSRAGRALDAELTSAADRLRSRAERALDAPPGEAAFAHLRPLAEGRGEYAIVLDHAGEPVAWAGEVRIDTDTLTGPVGVVQSEFYLVLHAVARRGASRAVATVVVEAHPPADRLTEPLERLVAERTGVVDFRFGGAADPSAGGFFRFAPAGVPLLDVSPVPPSRDGIRHSVIEDARVGGSVLLAIALAIFCAVVWRRERSIAVRLASLAVPLVCVLIVPLNELTNASRLFDPALYYAEFGGAFTANPGAFALTAGLALLGVLALLRSSVRVPSRAAAVGLVLAIAGGGPFLLRNLARGISPPTWGVSTGLWLVWEVALFLVGVSVVLAGATAGRAALREWRGLPPWLAPLLGAVAALIGPLVWDVRWPGWYPVLWTAAIGALALTRRSRRFVLAASTVAALGAATLVWGNVARKRVELAERDIAALHDAEPTAEELLRRLGHDLSRGGTPPSRSALLRLYASSDLAAASYPVSLTAWSPAGTPVATLSMIDYLPDSAGLGALVSEARGLGRPETGAVHGAQGILLRLAAPHPDGGTTTAVVVPRPRAEADDPFLALLGIGPQRGREPPYRVTFTEVADEALQGDSAVGWKRAGPRLHRDWMLAGRPTALRAHVEVGLRPYDAIFQRGALVLLLDLLVIGVLWALVAAADGGLGRWVAAQRRTWARSYRSRLTVGLFAFFVVPALVFAFWSYGGLRTSDEQARELLVRETLRAVATDAMGDLAAASQRFDTPILLYGPAELSQTSEPLYEALAPLGRFLAPDVFIDIVVGDEPTAARHTTVGSVRTLVGYRTAAGAAGGRVVLGAPARTNEADLERRRQDLSVLVLFVTAVGALGALWLSGVAARQLSQPIRALRNAAMAIARGEREPELSGEPPAEFVPVFTAFRRMAGDLAESRLALEEAQRRTAAILRNVASGVVAVDRRGLITLANPRADALLGHALPPGTPVAVLGSPELERRIADFTARDVADEEEFDVELDGRQLHARLTRLTRGGAGAVLTVDDVTELARAQRVLAWGEMARQVAHEIKNPLTPIRLGVQHLKRARAGGRGDFDRILDQNVTRILAEIDRLDEIARAFSRYGTAPEQQTPPQPIDVAAIVQDVVGLETMGEGSVEWALHDVARSAVALASGDELREVLLNILENARLAGARRVDVTVRRDPSTVAIIVADDGRGIPADVLPRIFEPHFSTRTSGSGLGLAISRRLIEGWGGSIEVTSAPGRGARVELTLVGQALVRS